MATMDSNNKWLKQQTTCLYCEKVLKNPRLLPCLHSYCSACLKKFLKEDENVVCPTCFENHGEAKQDVESMAKDVLGESLIHMGRTGEQEEAQTSCSSCDAIMAEAVDRCLDCSEFMCRECSDIHRRLRQTRDHEIITLQEYDDAKDDAEQIAHRSLYCDIHPGEELRYFCEKCKQIVCRECTIVKHKSHKYTYMEESSTVKQAVQTLEGLLFKTRSKVDKVKKAIDDVNTTSDLITASIAGLKNSIRATATEMVRNIRVAELEMITEIDRVQSRKFHGLNGQLKNLETNLEIYETGKCYAEHALKYLSEVELFLVKQPISDRLKALNKKKITHDPVEDNNLKHVRETKNGLKMARECLGCLEVNGNVVINGCVRDPAENAVFDKLKSLPSMVEPLQYLKGITVDIRGPGGELLSPLMTQRENPGEFGTDFQTERNGIHNVIVSIDGVPIQGSPLQVVICEPMVSPCGSSLSSPISPQNFGDNQYKLGGLRDVHGIAINNEEQILVTDTICHKVKIFDKTGKFLRMFGNLGTRNVQFNSPHGIAVTKEGHVVIADTGNDRIQIFDSNCKFLRNIDCHDNNGESFHPYDVAINHQDHNIISLDREKSKLRIYSAKDEIVREFGGVGSGDCQFINPSYIAVNQSGHVIVSDMGNDRIQVLTGTGQLLFKFGKTGVGNGEFRWPTGIAVKGNGDIVVVDSCNGRIQTFRADGSFESCWQQHGEGNLKLAEGLTVDKDDVIIIADWGNNRVQML